MTNKNMNVYNFEDKQQKFYPVYAVHSNAIKYYGVDPVEFLTEYGYLDDSDDEFFWYEISNGKAVVNHQYAQNPVQALVHFIR